VGLQKTVEAENLAAQVVRTILAFGFGEQRLTSGIHVGVPENGGEGRGVDVVMDAVRGQNKPIAIP